MKVLVADDSILFRRVMAEVLSSLPDVEVVGQAPNGMLALQKTKEFCPDLLTLDMEMPEMDGLAVLDALKGMANPPCVIVVSALTQRGGALTMQALQKGAFDFITKPDGAGGQEQSRAKLLSDLAPRIKAISLRLGVRGILRGVAAPAGAVPASAVVVQPSPPSTVPPPVPGSISERMNRLAGAVRPEMVLIGVSTGGPNALAALLPALPGRIGVPIFVVQHMPPIFTQSMADSLNAKCALMVCEASDGQRAAADVVYVAPGGCHMRLAPVEGGGCSIQITDDPPENNCRPAVDYLFRSASLHFPGRAMAVILTGMGSDGTLGLRLLKRRGCLAIAQNEATCVVYGMPKAAVDAGVVDEVLPLDAIAGRIVSALR
jgi:two-component system, chemotaxis family, protein-glutamate methylesterase/glutaminase